MTRDEYSAVEAKALADAEGASLIRWADGLQRCASAETFYREAVWVILCSGVSYRAARSMERTWTETGECAHPGKASALRAWRANHPLWWAGYQRQQTDTDRVAYLATLPFMGPALRYQLAKNLGCLGVCKPDRHLVRLAERFATTPQELCETVAAETGLTVAHVDTVLWFACMRRWLP